MTTALLLVVLILGQQPQPSVSGQAAGVLSLPVRGQVVHAQSAVPIADAQVALVEVNRTTRTDADGRFAFEPVPPGTYTVTVSTIGYIFVRRKVEVRDNAIDLLIPLAEGTGTYQESVTVTADAPVLRDPTSSSVQLGSAALVNLRGIAADDPVRAMQALPGVATGDDFQSEFSVRGAQFRQMGIVIDGTPTPLLFHAVRGADDTGSISMINTDVLSRASLDSGPHPRRHGDWVGGTMEFDVRDGSRDHTAIRGAVSGTSASIVADGPIGRGKRASWLVAARKSYVDWLVRKIAPSIDSTIGFSDVHAKLTYDLTSRQQLQLLVIGGDAEYLKSNATGANTIYRATSRSLLASLGWRYTPGTVVFSQRLSFSGDRFRDVGASTQEQAVGRTRDWAWRGDALWPISRAWTLEGGLRAEVQSTEATLRDLVTQGGVIRVRSQWPVDATATTTSAWTQVASRGKQRDVSIGARATYDTYFRSPEVAPWLLVEQRIGKFAITGSVGNFTQVPTPEEASRALRPLRIEHSFSTELGIGHALTSAIHWRLVTFDRQETHYLRRVLEDQLVNGRRVVGSPFPIYSSDLDGTGRGAEVVLERHAASGPNGWFSYTWSHTRMHDVHTNESFDGDFDQRHTLNAFVQQRLSYRMMAAVRLRYGSNFPLVGYFAGTPPDALVLAAERNRVRLPTYFRMDVRGSRTFTFDRRRLTLFVEMVNVTGRTNYGRTDGSIRANLDAIGYLEKLLPFVPSAGVLIEF